MTKIYEANNHILIHTGYASPEKHRHMAAQIVLAIDGKMSVVSEETEYHCRGVLLPAGTPHLIDTYGKVVLVFLYDPASEVAKQIEHIRCVSEDTCNRILEQYGAFERDGDYSIFERYFLKELDITPGSSCSVTDERIRAAIKYIRDGISENITCKAVAEAVYMSQGRFSHVFKEQVGMTFAAYVIYQRIMYVYAQIFRGKSITEAAVEAGFSSSAHFADVNRRVFGITASRISQDARFIRIQ